MQTSTQHAYFFVLLTASVFRVTGMQDSATSSMHKQDRYGNTVLHLAAMTPSQRKILYPEATHYFYASAQGVASYDAQQARVAAACIRNGGHISIANAWDTTPYQLAQDNKQWLPQTWKVMVAGSIIERHWINKKSNDVGLASYFTSQFRKYRYYKNKNYVQTPVTMAAHYIQATFFNTEPVAQHTTAKQRPASRVEKKQ